jgi:hypothetical protein
MLISSVQGGYEDKVTNRQYGLHAAPYRRVYMCRESEFRVQVTKNGREEGHAL